MGNSIVVIAAIILIMAGFGSYYALHSLPATQPSSTSSVPAQDNSPQPDGSVGHLSLSKAPVMIASPISLTGVSSPPPGFSLPSSLPVTSNPPNASSTPPLVFTPSIPPGGISCPADSGQQCPSSLGCPYYFVACEAGMCSSVSNGPYVNTHYGPLSCAQINSTNIGTYSNNGYWCLKAWLAPGNGTYCIGKPVIYLYPEKDLTVNVTISVPGQIVVSDPEYGQGWTGVLAHPNGDLEYKNQKYKELFYESTVNKVPEPESGIILKKQYLQDNLNGILLKYGLNQTETNEFLAYWMPQLKELRGDYVLFSVYNKMNKESIDKVNVEPEPETRIEVLVYFRPLEQPIEVAPLILPEKPPARVGFTEVEWGGTIDKN